MSNLTKRSLTGLLFTLTLLVTFIASQYTMVAMVLLIAVLCITEYYNMAKMLELRPQIATGYSVSILVIGLSFLIVKKIIPFESAIILLPVLFTVFVVQLYHKHKKPIENIGFTFIPVIHIAVPLALMVVLALFGEEYDYQINVGLLLLIWASDTFAYLVGVSIGRTPLFPRISPKKSWEGFVGGMLASFVASQYIAKYWTILSPIDWGVLALIVSVVGTWGDLVESMMKREANLKDSGGILPGHGGVLDRFDSLFMVVPFAFSYIYFVLMS